MEKIDLINLINKRYGIDSYRKGANYNKNYIRYTRTYRNSNNSKEHYFYVVSESSYRNYRVLIEVLNNEIIYEDCYCPQFQNYGTCKHVAACILNFPDIIFPEPKDPVKITSSFLDSLIETKKSNEIKEKVNLELELDLSSDNSAAFKLYIGIKKLYALNTATKYRDFMKVYFNGGNYSFGKSFEYNSHKHYFSDEDNWLLKFLYNDNNYNYYYNRSNDFDLNSRETKVLLDVFKNKRFKVKNAGYVNGIIEGFPCKIHIIKDNEEYKLLYEDIDKVNFLDGKIKYAVYNNMLYIIPNIYFQMVKTLVDNEIPYLSFKKDKINTFTNGLLKKIKDNVIVDEGINEIIVSGKPEISLYLDLLRDKIKCDIKLNYNGNIINYFNKTDNILRDDDEEEHVVNDLLNYNFVIDKEKFILVDIDDIGLFLTEGLTKLKEKYEIFTTKKFDNLSIKKTHVESNFSIGTDGIMSYDFSVDNVDLDEINGLLNSLKDKKRYYRLKNGDLLNLDNNELNELNGLVSDLELKSSDLNTGKIEIPKYRAFYIDSLKHNKYKSINTTSSFDNFINNFNKYKNIKLNLSPKDLEILRNYQVDGVKWLYTLYKCDLGGILADEMGLGKSIQTIYLIKEILKEKPNAKIMIVVPTALVYNWKREFDLFGSELNYVLVADNPTKRKEIINNFTKYNIFITTYGLIRNDNDEYEDKEFELCVIDEAQNIKNYQAGMTKEVKKIKARTKIALTGTPIENSVLELWSIFDFIMPGYLNSINKFKEKFGIKDIDNESLERLNDLNYQIKPFILRRKKIDVTKDLPDKLENNIYLELPDKQKALYLKELNTAKKEFEELLATEGFLKARFKILQLLMKLRQLCVDPSVLYENYKYDNIKLEKLVEIVQNYIMDGHKILIFSNFKRVIDHVKEIFDKENITSYMIAGDVKSKTRMELVDKFNNDDTNCFLITLKSGGVGLNLTGADVVIHLDIWWNPQVENQATDRAHRIGQTKNVSVIRLITKGTIEERILELQNKKRILSENLIEGNKDASIINTISEEEMKDLLSYGDDEE